jgi:hypothetical protein
LKLKTVNCKFAIQLLFAAHRDGLVRVGQRAGTQGAQGNSENRAKEVNGKFTTETRRHGGKTQKPEKFRRNEFKD